MSSRCPGWTNRETYTLHLRLVAKVDIRVRSHANAAVRRPFKTTPINDETLSWADARFVAAADETPPMRADGGGALRLDGLAGGRSATPAERR